MIKNVGCLLVLLSVLMIMGCSGGGNAVLPVDPDYSSVETQDLNNQGYAYPGVLGAWKVILDKENMTAEIEPARNSAKIGDTFDADLSQFLTVSPCENCLSIANISIDADQNVLLGVRMRHPFTNISARPDLHGFDVRAIFITAVEYSSTNPLKMTNPDGTEEDVSYYSGFILNADGFTSHYRELLNDPRYFLHPVETVTNLNPFLRFFESYGTDTFDPANPTGHNVMAVGDTQYERTAVISRWTQNKTSFYIVADVAYGQSAVFSSRANPKYYLPAFNRTEPWRMEYWIENNNLSFTDANSSADLVVQVFDWQHSATVDPGYPNPANLSGVKESSKVSAVELSLPNMMSDPLSATIPEAGDGSPTNPLRYRFTVRNELLYTGGIIDGFIAVRDQLYGAISPSGRMPIPQSPSGFPYATLDIRDYAYYGPVTINFPVTSTWAPFGSELYIDNTDLFGRSGTSVDADFFMDYSNKKFQYRWDYDYDGVTFDIDGSGLPSPYVNFSSPGKKNFALRVRTNAVPPREYIYKIPVYAEGLADTHRVDDSDNKFATSDRGSHAVAFYDDTFYFVYESYGNIYLARYKEGNIISNTQITMDSHNFSPAIAICPTGANAGVYVVFVEEEGMPEIQSTWGNLDGTGFDDAHLRDLPVGNGARQPCLVYVNNILYCIFQEIKGGAPAYNRITSMRSTDFAQSWIDKYFIDDNSDYQYNPSVTLDIWSRFNVVWEDYRDDATLGSDIYLGYSDDCLYWWGSHKLVNTTQNIDEYSPSIAHASEKTGVVYVSQRDGSTYSNLRIHIVGYSGEMDMALDDGYGKRLYRNPSIDVIYTSQYQAFYLISYALYDMDTGLLESRSRCYTDRNGWDLLNDIFTVDEEVGTVSPASADGARTYPGVYGRSVASGNAIEHYIVRKTLADGFAGGGANIYGKLDVLYYISDGNDQY